MIDIHREDPSTQMGSPTFKAQSQLIHFSTMTMEDYGLTRLSDLREQLSSSEDTDRKTRIEEIIKVLSDLAASLRDGGFRSKLELTFRIRTRAAARVCITDYAG